MIPFRVCIFGGGGGTLYAPKLPGRCGRIGDQLVIQGNVTFIATNMYSGTTTISAGRYKLGDGTDRPLGRAM